MRLSVRITGVLREKTADLSYSHPPFGCAAQAGQAQMAYITTGGRENIAAIYYRYMKFYLLLFVTCGLSLLIFPLQSLLL